MPREITGTWTQKVSHEDLWNTLILDATLVVSGDEISWHGAVSSERYGGPFQSISRHAPNTPVHLDATLPGGLRLTGDVTLRTWEEQWILWTPDLSYHYPGQTPQKVEGSLLAFGTPLPPPTPPPCPPTPPPPPCPPDDDSVLTPIVRPAHGREGTLFPYQYLRAWPAPPLEEIALGFAPYPPRAGAKLPDTFIQCLQPLKATGGPGARLAMQQAAVAYIEGRTFDGRAFDAAPFVPELADLPAPFSLYPEARAVIVASLKEPPAVVLKGLRARVGSPELDGEAYLQALTRAWQSLFARAVARGYDRSLRDALLDVVVVDHLLAWLAMHHDESVTSADLEALAGASVVLPASVFPLPPAGLISAATPNPSSEWIVPYAVGDLQLVKQRLVGYALGEIAHVQSVMAGERRKTVQRRASRVLRTVARTASDDHSSGSGNLSLTDEVRSTIEDAVTTATFKNFSTTYGPPAPTSDDAEAVSPTTCIDGSWTLERAPAGGPSSKSLPSDASRYARKVLERAVQRVANKVVEARVTETLREAEETTTSELDNTSGTTGRRGIFRWLNEIHETFVVNHGSRLVLEIVLAAPGAAYLRDAIELPPTAVPPVPPEALGITSYKDVTRDSFPLLAARYLSDALSLPPPPCRSTSGWARSGEPLSLTLPEGYVSTQISVGCMVTPGQSPLTVSGVAGRTAIQMPDPKTGVYSQTLLGERGTVHVLLQTSSGGASPTDQVRPAGEAPGDPPVTLTPVQLVVAIDAAPDACMAEWQFRTFQAVLAAYAVQVETYRGTRLGESAGAVPAPRLGARAVEQREIKRGAFDLLFQKRAGRVGSEAAGVDAARPCYLRFFERAFEWPEMSYGFLHDTASATAAKRLTEGDDRFVDFLEAAYAQVLLPVSLRDALPVLFFLASGVLWDGAGEAAPVHEADVALACALKQLLRARREHRCEGEPWEVILPTTAAVLQDGSGTLCDLAAVRADVSQEEA
ncbi:hypothetical protein [Sorangium sp. So ce1151]|uniref:hypothetical protein n=1 Tax=Sorangium sp. So ce1151 TaxID=3133332 RepID=UPI003F5EBA83